MTGPTAIIKVSLPGLPCPALSRRAMPRLARWFCPDGCNCPNKSSLIPQGIRQSVGEANPRPAFTHHALGNIGELIAIAREVLGSLVRIASRLQAHGSSETLFDSESLTPEGRDPHLSDLD